MSLPVQALPPVETQVAPSVESEIRIDFLTLMVMLARTRRRVVLMTAGGLALGVTLGLVSKPVFTATATILPPRQSISSASAIMGGLSGLGGGGSLLGLKSPADMYIGILASRTVAENVISACHLREFYRTRTLVDTEAALQAHSTFETGKDDLIHISVKDSDPKKASEIANSYLDQLYDINTQLETGEAAQRRVFYDRRLAEEKQALSKAEEDMRNTQQKTGVIQLGGQTASIINSIAQARASLAGREVELQAMRTYAAQDNPQAMQLSQEVAGLKANLAQLERNQQTIQPGDLQIPGGQLPESALKYQRQMRELKYHETLYDLLTRQNQAAKLDEAKTAPILQVVDRAVPPDKKSGPSRKLLAIGFTTAGFLLAATWGLLELLIQRIRRVPEQAQKLDELRAAFRLH